MKIVDKSAFLPHTSILQIKLNSGETRKYSISLNPNVDTYYTVRCNLAFFEENQNANYIIDTVTKILQSADKHITRNWVIKNIGIDSQQEIIIQVVNGINKLLSAEYLQIPDIQVNKKTGQSKYEKERAEKQDKIKSANNQLAKKQEINLIDDIGFVMMKTGNTYKDIMNMPVLFFKDLVKFIIISDLCIDEDYYLAYLEYKFMGYKNEIKSGQANIKPVHPKGADLKLKRLKEILSK